jgi:tetratricopeptide (TPR) repeat protein
VIAVVHYTDENLIAMLEAGDEEVIRRNPHLASCDVCRQSLDEYRAIVGVLGDEAAWDYQNLKSPDPDPSTVAVLRAFATSMQNEDEAAVAYVAALLEGPRDTWMPRLRAHPEWRTAGVVRKLVGDAYAALTRMPPDGVEMTALAIEISDHLPEDTYPSDTVPRLRGHAWREHAYALFYVGEFKQSLVACDRADAALSRCVVDEYDRARVGVVRALSLRPLDEVVEGAALAASAAVVFASHGDNSRVVAAAITSAQMQASASVYRGAICQLSKLLSHAPTLSASSRAILEGNLAYCYRYDGDVESSIHHYQLADAMFEEAGSITERARVQWNIGALLGAVGRTSEALKTLLGIRAEFDALGMPSEGAMIALELAELLLTEERFEDAEMFCRDAYQQFERSGLGFSTRAMTAIAYLQEAVRLRSVTPKVIRHVRDYVRRLPEDPNLLFAPPPL